MSTKTEVENIKTSGSEKVLAGVLAIFILIGGVWAYSQIGKISEETYHDTYMGPMHTRAQLSPRDESALEAADQARNQVWHAQSKVRKAERQIEFTGDAYRTEIDAGLSGTAQLAAYRDAQRQLVEAKKELKSARQSVEQATPAAEIARDHARESRQEAERQRRSDDRWVAILRLALVGAMLGGGVWALSICRRRRSRFTPLALAEIVAGAMLAAWMAIDYGTSLEVFREIGPLTLSIVGILLTTLAFVALQRYLAKKVPARRVRRAECPFCGYPARSNSHCEGCGRRVLGECSTCHEPRRVSTPHCGSCGAV